MSSERVKALWEFGKVIFGRNNLIGTDFSDVLAHKDEQGVTFQFHISHNALARVQVSHGAYVALGLFAVAKGTRLVGKREYPDRAKSDERVCLHVELRTLRPGARESSPSWDGFDLGEWHLPDADAIETMSRVDPAVMDAGFEPYNVPS